MSVQQTVSDELQEQIDAIRRVTRTDEYSMSLGELANLYQDHELQIQPEFQRFYRWRDSQKTRLIESFLLGIPVPPIFVSQRDDGKWDVVDGQQRLSTVFEFMGILRGEDGTVKPPLRHRGTGDLPALEAKVWEDADEPPNALSQEQRLDIKRCRLGVIIVKKESATNTKFELFMRLNTGGTPLSEQEVRSCLMVMKDQEFYKWLRELADDEFQRTLALTDRALDEQYDVELALRFLVFRTLEEDQLRGIGDVGDFVTKRMTWLIDNADRAKEAAVFRWTFGTIGQVGPDAFRRFDHARSRFVGGFLISAFEVVALGLGYHAEARDHWTTEGLKHKLREVWTEPTLSERSGAGVRGSTRLPLLVPLGRRLFDSENPDD